METLAACLGLGPPSSGHWGRRPSFIGQLWKWGRGGGDRSQLLSLEMRHKMRVWPHPVGAPGY